jgi:hypothetical protein
MHIARFSRQLALLALLFALPVTSFAGIAISVTVAPPPLPVYAQPVCPEPGYMWTPGYWAWGDDGYYWVPGTWVPAPAVGLLWTPGYWGWNNGLYIWNAGYWGPHIGFYGGVNYGFGYGGVGFVGGEWRGGAFFYNRAVLNIGGGPRFTNVYVNKTVIVNNVTRVSYNGGTGGIRANPRPADLAAARERHAAATSQQVQQENTARQNPQLRARNNGGRPAIAATARPADFKSAVPARAAGGRIPPTSLNATAKSMPPASKGGAPARAATPPPSRSPNTRNVPNKPPAANARPSAAPRSTPPSRASTPRPRNTPPPRTAPQAHAAPAPRSSPPPRASAPPPSRPQPQQKDEREKR